MADTIAAMEQLVIDQLREKPNVPQDISAESRIVEDLAFDSLAVMNFVMEIEDRLDVSLPLDQLADIRTIHDLAVCLQKLKAAA